MRLILLYRRNRKPSFSCATFDTRLELWKPTPPISKLNKINGPVSEVRLEISVLIQVQIKHKHSAEATLSKIEIALFQ